MVLKEYMYLPIWGEVQRLQELHRERNQSWTSAFHSCNKSRAWLDVMGELAINVMGELAHQPGLQPGSSLVIAKMKPGDLRPGQAVEPSQVPVGSWGWSQTQTPWDSTGQHLCPAGVCAGSTATGTGGHWGEQPRGRRAALLQPSPWPDFPIKCFE